MESLWAAMDRDRSESIDVDEFCRGMRRLDLGFTRGELRSIFAGLDEDCSGTIDHEEFLHHLKRRTSLHESVVPELKAANKTPPSVVYESEGAGSDSCPGEILDMVDASRNSDTSLVAEESSKQNAVESSSMVDAAREVALAIARESRAEIVSELVTAQRKSMASLESMIVSIASKSGADGAKEVFEQLHMRGPSPETEGISLKPPPPPTVRCNDGLYRPRDAAVEHAIVRAKENLVHAKVTAQCEYNKWLEISRTQEDLERAHIHAEAVASRDELALRRDGRILAMRRELKKAELDALRSYERQSLTLQQSRDVHLKRLVRRLEIEHEAVERGVKRRWDEKVADVLDETRAKHVASLTDLASSLKVAEHSALNAMSMKHFRDKEALKTGKHLMKSIPALSASVERGAVEAKEENVEIDVQTLLDDFKGTLRSAKSQREEFSSGRIEPVEAPEFSLECTSPSFSNNPSTQCIRSVALSRDLFLAPDDEISREDGVPVVSEKKMRSECDANVPSNALYVAERGVASLNALLEQIDEGELSEDSVESDDDDDDDDDDMTYRTFRPKNTARTVDSSEVNFERITLETMDDVSTLGSVTGLDLVNRLRGGDGRSHKKTGTGRRAVITAADFLVKSRRFPNTSKMPKFSTLSGINSSDLKSRASVEIESRRSETVGVLNDPEDVRVLECDDDSMPSSFEHASPSNTVTSSCIQRHDYHLKYMQRRKEVEEILERSGVRLDIDSGNDSTGSSSTNLDIRSEYAKTSSNSDGAENVGCGVEVESDLDKVGTVVAYNTEDAAAAYDARLRSLMNLSFKSENGEDEEEEEESFVSSTSARANDEDFNQSDARDSLTSLRKLRTEWSELLDDVSEIESDLDVTRSQIRSKRANTKEALIHTQKTAASPFFYKSLGLEYKSMAGKEGRDSGTPSSK
eukprot:g790.t1